MSKDQKNKETKQMSETTETTSPETKTSDTSTASIKRGFQVRTFEGSIAEEKDKAGKVTKAEIKYKYDRVLFPWSRAGKDADGNDAEGAVPSLAEAIAFIQTELKFPTEIPVDKNGNMESPSVVFFICEGLNKHLTQTARIKAENTPDSAKEAAISVFMKKTGMSRKDAEEFLATAFAK